MLFLAAFELVKVRRQLEYSIAEEKGLKCIKPPSTTQAVKDIIHVSGIFGLYNGFRLHLRKSAGCVASSFTWVIHFL